MLWALERETDPTDSNRERQLGRIALSLDPEDVRWLSTNCDCPPDAPEGEKERCARIRFRANAALHKGAPAPGSAQ
jgi:hypothetical protein